MATYWLVQRHSVEDLLTPPVAAHQRARAMTHSMAQALGIVVAVQQRVVQSSH